MIDLKDKQITNDTIQKINKDLDLCHAGQDALYGEGTQFLPEIKIKWSWSWVFAIRSMKEIFMFNGTCREACRDTKASIG